MIWGVTGELREPSNRSGVTDWDGCSHVPPASCTSCDGTRAETAEVWRATRDERRAYLRDMAAWSARRTERAVAALTADQTNGDDAA